MPVAAATLTFKGSNRSRSRIRLICHSLLIKIAARPAAAVAAGAAAALIGSSNCAIISEIVQDDLLLL